MLVLMNAITLAAISYVPSQDILTQLTLQERHSKLQETYESLLEGEYGDLVGVDVEPFLDGPGGEDDDDEEDEGGTAQGNGWLGMFGGGGAAGGGGKRRKV